jgi:hypothetical protein
MRDTPILFEGLFSKGDPLAGVTADECGPEIAAALGLQDAVEKDTAELLDTCKQWGETLHHCLR